jgi:hypothetical protein
MKRLAISILGLVVVLGAAVVAVRANSAPVRTSPVVLNLSSYGGPTKLDGYVVPLGTVPKGKTWTVKYFQIMVEKHTGEPPRGGEFTISLMINGRGFAHSSSSTGQRISAQAQAATSVTLPAGTKLAVSVWLGRSNGGNVASDDDIGHYFYSATALIQQS